MRHVLQGELSPGIRNKQLEVLEKKYQGSSLPPHRAATIIQTAWREHALRTQFRRMLDLAKSVENVRMSGVENSGHETDTGSTGAAARHIQSRRHMRRHNAGHMAVKRSTSLRDHHRRSGSWSGGFQPIDKPEEEEQHDQCHDNTNNNNVENKESSGQRLRPSNSWTESRPQTAADVQNKLNETRDTSPQSSPVPPCPPLRGRDFYPDQEPVYSFARDSVYCSVRRPRRMPPRPPQRTVSFLGQEPTPHHMGHLVSTSALPTSSDLMSRPGLSSVSDSRLPGITRPDPARTLSTCHLPAPATCHVSHNRTHSTPACHNAAHKKASPLPPPPYVPPPSVQHRDPNEPLPPPPAPVEIMETRQAPCDSVSSIDSGFR